MLFNVLFYIGVSVMTRQIEGRGDPGPRLRRVFRAGEGPPAGGVLHHPRHRGHPRPVPRQGRGAGIQS
ncbi:MAG: hypothetical protein MZV70_59245 [Desulfobacterales bacterium]|nr:hypothetical protein [Desulfobacterales bacterium]